MAGFVPAADMKGVDRCWRITEKLIKFDTPNVKKSKIMFKFVIKQPL